MLLLITGNNEVEPWVYFWGGESGGKAIKASKVEVWRGLEDMPGDFMRENVFKYLGMRDLFNLAGVNKRWYKLVKGEHLLLSREVEGTMGGGYGERLRNWVERFIRRNQMGLREGGVDNMVGYKGVRELVINYVKGEMGKVGEMGDEEVWDMIGWLMKERGLMEMGILLFCGMVVKKVKIGSWKGSEGMTRLMKRNIEVMVGMKGIMGHFRKEVVGCMRVKMKVIMDKEGGREVSSGWRVVLRGVLEGMREWYGCVLCKMQRKDCLGDAMGELE